MSLLFIILQAVAFIAFPTTSQTVRGPITITGTASHPQFARYEIAFAYDPNPTDTWFELRPPSTAQVTDGPLASWDTTRISDGTYMIRLRVYGTDSTIPIETTVRGIKVQNSIPPTLAPTSTTAPLLATPTTPPTSTPVAAIAPTSAPVIPTPEPFLPTFDFSPYTSAFCNGIYFTLFVFLLMGLYAALRDRIRRPLWRWIRRVLSDIKKP
jgi:hypothetical protein